MGLLSTIGDIALGAAATSILTKKLKKGGGAMPPAAPGTEVNFFNNKGNTVAYDNRVMIKVPSEYLTSKTTGLNQELGVGGIGGIVFPYTPSITVENKADYESSTPVHSNFTQYYYKHSSVSSIAIQGKFTVQNEKDAGVYLATVHLLRALTKMRFGTDGDNVRGAPPPVCRLYGWGDFMLKYVPVSITSFRLELPDSVDYFTLGNNPNSDVYPSPIFGKTSVPTVSTIAVTCIPMFSRQEMLNYGVNDWLTSSNLRTGKGFL
jgi:hypothetical protein